MKTLRYLTLIIGSIFLFMPVTVDAITYDFYETVDNTPGGTPSDIGPSLLLSNNLDPNVRVSGYVVLLESGNPALPGTWDKSQANFSDVLTFYYKDATGNVVSYDDTNAIRTSIYATLFSDIIPDSIYSGAYNYPYTRYHIEDPSGITSDVSPTSGNIYNIHSGLAPVPIPGAVWLFGSGLLGLVGIGRRRMKK